MNASPFAKPPSRLDAFRPYWPVVVLVSLFLVNNIMIVALLDWMNVAGSVAPVFAVLEYGVVIAQLVLHSIWTVFGNWRLPVRMLLSVSTALLLVISFFLMPLYWALANPTKLFGEFYWHSLLILSLSLPIFFLAVELPFWVFKAFRGWQVSTAQDAMEVRDSNRTTIGSLLVATTIVAIALASVRLSTMLPLRNRSVADASIFLWWLVPAGVLSLATLLIAVPPFVAVLRARHVVFWLAVVVVVDVVFLSALLVILGLFGSAARLEEWLAFFGMFISFFVSLTVPLIIARRLGYRLQTGRDIKRQLAPQVETIVGP